MSLYKGKCCFKRIIWWDLQATVSINGANTLFLLWKVVELIYLFLWWLYVYFTRLRQRDLPFDIEHKGGNKSLCSNLLLHLLQSHLAHEFFLSRSWHQWRSIVHHLRKNQGIQWIFQILRCQFFLRWRNFRVEEDSTQGSLLKSLS